MLLLRLGRYFSQSRGHASQIRRHREESASPAHIGGAEDCRYHLGSPWVSTLCGNRDHWKRKKKRREKKEKHEALIRSGRSAKPTVLGLTDLASLSASHPDQANTVLVSRRIVS